MSTQPLGAWDVALAVVVLAVTTLALTARARRAQAMAFLGLGVLISLVWLRLGSLDVALAEAALGSGLLGALLVWLAIADRPPDRPPGAPHSDMARWARPLLAVLVGSSVVLVVGAIWWRAEQRLPAWTDPLSTGMDDTGVSHEVTAVLLSFRAYDTLLESAVLMLAGIAVLSVGTDPTTRPASAGSTGLPAAARWLVLALAPVLLLGLWVLFVGSSGPGGAFQSGALLAGLLILLHAAQVRMGPLRTWLAPLVVVGVVVFVLAGALGPLTGGAWLEWHPAWAFGAILTVEVGLTAGISAALFLLYLALVEPREPPGAAP